MKKKKIIVILCVICALLIIYNVGSSAYQKAEEEYFYKINSIIKDYEFRTAKVEGSKIKLYDAERTMINEIDFDEYNPIISLEYIRKDGIVMSFITYGVVDDEFGIVFINGEANGILDGIKSLDRVGGNSYRYSTKD